MLEPSGFIVLDQHPKRFLIKLMQDVAQPFIIPASLPECRAIVLAKPPNKDVAELTAYIAILVAIASEGHFLNPESEGCLITSAQY